MELKRVVVTGMGALTPLGNTVDEYWNSLINGVSGADMITLFDASKFRTKFACEVKGFDPQKYFDRKEARKMDLYTQYALVATAEAIENSGIDLEAIDKDEVGMVVLASMSLVITPPIVSIPSDNGVTSRRTTSLTSPVITPP